MFEISRNGVRSAESDILRVLFFEALGSPGELSPTPGFYERVRSRIQEIERQSIWAPLIYSRFHWLLVTACLALALAAISYAFSAGWKANDAIFSANPQQQRDAVLTQIVTYRKPN